MAWRSATFLGPPLTDTERPRRDIQEYVHAMGAFFCRGPGHRRFLVSEMREGVLHELCGQLGLPPHTTDIDTIAAVMERWKQVAGGIGENITVNLPDRSISGRFAGIDDTGLLKLETDDGGTRLIAAGDVFFG